MKSKTLKVIFTIIAISIFIGMIIYLIPVMKNISTQEGQIAFKEKVQDMGLIGFLLLFLLDVAQIFLVILPGEPLEILAGMCYGVLGGSLFIFVTVFVTTTLIVYLVRRYGKKILYNTFSKEKINKIEQSKFFKNEKKVILIISILFLIPGTPKDILVYIGGLLPVSPIKFILISTFMRFPSVISSTIAGAGITSGNFNLSIISYVVTFAISFIIVIIVNALDKEKITKEAIDTIK